MAKEKKVKKTKEEPKVTKKETAKKVAPKKEAPKKEVAPRQSAHAITTIELADKLGTTPKALRNFLRTNFEHLRGEGYTAWGWDKWNDPQLKEIMSSFASREKKESAPKKEAHAKAKTTKKVEKTVEKKAKTSKKEKEEVAEKPKKKKKKSA